VTKKHNVNIDSLKQKAQIVQSKEYALSEDFINVHMGLIKSIAKTIVSKNMMPTCIEFDDLVSWGVEGLVKARQAYSPDKGAQFKTYAYIKIRGAILDRIRREWEYRNPSQFLEKKENRIKQLQSAIQSFPIEGEHNKSDAVDILIEDSMTAYMVSLDPQLIDFELKSEQAENPEIQFVDRSETVLWDEVKHLVIEEQQFIRLFYVVGLNQTEIAQKLNMSKSKVSRLHKNIITKLKRRLKLKYNEYG